MPKPSTNPAKTNQLGMRRVRMSEAPATAVSSASNTCRTGGM